MAEILDVPEDISCFQTAPGTVPCFGTRGATEIRITDSDREFTYLCLLVSVLKLGIGYSSWSGAYPP